MKSDGLPARRFLGWLLWLVSLLYGAAIRLRTHLYKKGCLAGKTLPCMVISIGNITLGGTGKTPMVVYLGRHLSALGHRVAVVSRGYKGSASKSGGIVSDGRALVLNAEASGDEPQLMARILHDVPVLVDSKRYRAGMTAIQNFQPDILLLDDAFQHLGLKRDLDIILMDADRPLGNGHLFPRGTLREPSPALSRGDAFVFTRGCFENKGLDKAVKEWIGEKPVFHSIHEPYVYTIVNADSCDKNAGIRRDNSGEGAQYPGTNVFGFSGIANNDELRRTISKMGYNLAGFLDFDDHHWYTDSDLRNITAQATEMGAKALVTTLKDMVRFKSSVRWPMDLVVLDINIRFFGDGFEAFLTKKIDEFLIKNNHRVG